MTYLLARNSLVSFLPLVIAVFALLVQFHGLRVVSLSLVASVIGGAYSAMLATSLVGSSHFGIAVAGACVGGVATGLAGGLLDRRFVNARGPGALLASLGFLTLLQGAILTLGGGGISSFRVSSLPLGARTWATPTWLPLAISVAVVVVFVQAIAWQKTMLGLSATALGDDPTLAAEFGVPVSGTQTIIQALGGLFAGLGGLLLAIDGGLRPDLGFSVMLQSFGVLILAGPSVVGLIAWAAVVAGMKNVVAFNYGGHLGEAAAIGSLAVAIMIRARHQPLWR